MAHNQTGIAIVIKAFLPTGKTLDEQFTALSIVKDAHANGDYSTLLLAAQIDEVKTEQKTRRVEGVAPAGNDASDADQPKPTSLPQNGAEASSNTAGDASSGDFDAGLDEPRVNPEDSDDAGDIIPSADETVDLIDGPLHEPIEKPVRRRTAR